MKTVHVFLAVDMRCGHDGLILHAKTAKVDLKEMTAGTACVFISRDRLRIKVYSFNGVLSYLKAPDYRPFDLNAIDEFPKAFDKDGTMDYSKALKARLIKVMSKRGALEEDHLGT